MKFSSLIKELTTSRWTIPNNHLSGDKNIDEAAENVLRG